MEHIRLIFVLPEKYDDYKEASEIMVQAFEACKQTVKSDITWIKERDFEAVVLNKTDFVIFEEFKGETFEKLKETKCARILGPWAISICLMEGKSIPNFPWPIYNVAMYDCIVTCSNLSKVVKMQIKEKVHVLGGCYVDTLVEKITHLVTNNPNSEKYLTAAEAGVKLMCSSWIDAVWEASQTVNVHADDSQFEEHRCLPFQNLSICCTGITNATERKDLEMQINKFGGRYTGKLDLLQTDILVCVGSCSTEKYKAARKRKNIKCVNISWIYDSIEKGYALPHHLYQVHQKFASTPTKNVHIIPDFSVLSAVSNTSQRLNIEDTVNVTSSPRYLDSSRSRINKRKGNLNEEYCQLVDKLDIKRAKKAGQYLDGCSVYITGFNAEHSEKLCKVLNLSGATRYDQFSDRVTHVIVGDPNFHEVKLIKSKGGQCSLVTVQWLLDSLEKEQPVSEEKYLLNSLDLEKSGAESPLSKKGLSLLRSNKTITENEVEETKENTVSPTGNVDKEIIQQYLTTNTVQEEDTLAILLKAAENAESTKQIEEPPNEILQFRPSNTSTQQSSMPITQDEISQADIFEGLKFLLSGFEEEASTHLKKMIEDYSGEVVSKNFKGIPDYAVVPAFNNSELKHTAAEVVNELFIHECHTEGVLIDKIEYYHRPCDAIDMEPLENCVVTISSYSSYQRNFLQGLIETLGGLHQEQFSRITSEAKGVVASTHLVSDEASGKKYLAALKWNLPVINKDWLLDCAKTGTRAPEQNYLVGDSKAPKKADNNEKNSTPTTSASGTNSAAKIATPNTSHMKNRLNSSVLNTSKVNTPPCANTIGTALDNSVQTPNNQNNPNNSGFTTPVNQLLARQLSFNGSGDKMFSQVTPINTIVQQYRESNIDYTPVRDSPAQFRYLGIKTPETPLGACIQANPTPQMKKELEYWIRQFPDFEPPVQRRLSTPLSELKRQLWDKILHRGESQQTQDRRKENEDEEMDAQAFPLDVAHSSREAPENVFETPPGRQESTQNRLIDSRLQQLEEMLSASGGGRRQSRNFQSTIPIPEGNNEYKDSQAGTVGWDFKEPEVAPKQKLFSLSGIGNSEIRATMVQQLEGLGASASDLTNYDPSSTHLLSPKPARNEKTLSFMAAGKWILHTSYLEKSFAEGYFLNEEEFEYGNPQSAGKFEIPCEKDIETRMRSMYWWRREISRRGYGAFNDMRAIVVAQKRDLIVRVIEAGGGVVIDVSPPFENPVHATHCLLEPRSVRDMADYIPLAQQGIFLLNTIYISDYLHNPNKDIKECILPYFAKYYSRS